MNMNELKETKRRRRRVQKKRTIFSLPIELQFLILNSLTPTELNNFLITCKCFWYETNILERKNNLTQKEKLIRTYSPNNPKKNYIKILLSFKPKSKIYTRAYYDLSMINKPLIQFLSSIVFPVREYSRNCKYIQIYLNDTYYPIIQFGKNISIDYHFDINKIASILKNYYCSLNIEINDSESLIITNKKKILLKIIFGNYNNGNPIYFISL